MTREDRMAQAGDFVLGLMEDAERKAFEATLAGDPELASMVEALRGRMGALDDTVTPDTVPAGLWARIEARLSDTGQITGEPLPGVVELDAKRRERAGRLNPGRLAAMAATVLVAIGIGYLAGGGLRQPAEPVAIAVLLDETDRTPGAIVEAFADDSVRLKPLKAYAVPEGQIMEVWTLPDAETGPVSLGTLAAPGTALLAGPDLPLPKEGQLYEITLEAKPRSATGRPTGPILVKGYATLTAAR